MRSCFLFIFELLIPLLFAISRSCFTVKEAIGSFAFEISKTGAFDGDSDKDGTVEDVDSKHVFVKSSEQTLICVSEDGVKVDESDSVSESEEGVAIGWLHSGGIDGVKVSGVSVRCSDCITSFFRLSLTWPELNDVNESINWCLTKEGLVFFNKL